MANSKLPASGGDEVDVVLIGAGAMSMTPGVLLKELEPSWSQVLFGHLGQPTRGSFFLRNNTGTSHPALCKLSYTPEKNGKVDITEAKTINKQSQMSRQLWTSLVENGTLTDSRGFTNPINHTTLVQGPEQMAFMHHRYEALKEEPLFPGQRLTEDPDRLAECLPLVSEGRDFSKPVSAIRNPDGTGVNFDALTKQYLATLSDMGTEIRYGYRVTGLKRDGSRWAVTVESLHTKDVHTLIPNLVFIGVGGDVLLLLQKTRVNEIHGFDGFLASDQWLRCTSEEVIAKYDVKVYDGASVGMPPVSVPHLDTRIIDGRRGLLFGPYAGRNMKFLKSGNNLDLIKSLHPINPPSMIGVGVQEMGLTKHLTIEVLKDLDARIESLREHIPNARPEDWELIAAGQRVRVIRPTRAPVFGTLGFGTAVINSWNGTIADLVGAPPGTSIAPVVVISLIEYCFGHHMGKWTPKPEELVPSHGTHLADDPALFKEVWEVP